MTKSAFGNFHKVAVVGLRSGSKSIPDKNIRALKGKPLFYWIIRAAMHSRLIQSIVVSSDSVDYLDMVRHYFPDVLCILRPAKLALDSSVEVDFVKHAIDSICSSTSMNPHNIVYARLHATSPLQSPEDIDRSFEFLSVDPSYTSGVVLRLCNDHPLKSIHIKKSDDGLPIAVSMLDNLCESVTPVNRQDYSMYYMRGNIITGLYKNLLIPSLTGSKCMPVISSAPYNIDIDTEEDFRYAEYIMSLGSSPISF